MLYIFNICFYGESFEGNRVEQVDIKIYLLLKTRCGKFRTSYHEMDYIMKHFIFILSSSNLILVEILNELLSPRLVFQRTLV
jgi:hypothetical protein